MNTLLLLFAMSLSETFPAEDPHLWLEEVEGERALDWAKARSAEAMAGFEGNERFRRLRDELLQILDTEARIPYVSEHRGRLYNFWRDAKNRRGLWRRTTLEEYRKPQPAWEIVLDLDALAEAEKENWVWAGAELLPDGDRALIRLSRGGADATVVREFDLGEKRFVEGGFALPEAKSWVSWRSPDEIFVGTDFGPGSLTSSGYPRTARLWRRGTSLDEAPEVFAGEGSDVFAGVSVVRSRGHVYELALRRVGFFTSRYFLRQADGSLRPLEVPEDAEIGFAGDQLLIELKSDWSIGEKRWPQGALLATSLPAFLDGGRDFVMLFEPGPRRSLGGYAVTRSAIVVHELDNVLSRLYEWRQGESGLERRAIPVPPASLGVFAFDDEKSDAYFVNAASFLEPDTLYLAEAGREGWEKLKALPAQFDASGLEVKQYEATSKDGTRIPYFLIARKDLPLDGENPTLLYGYGGFEVPLRPAYAPLVGKGWLEAGGVYAVANIRGGGEFAPAWHRAALRENRQRAYDDFIAVAEDLIARKITSAKRLGIRGGSNGGLLTGVMLTQRPDLFGAVVIQVPLLDMRRYHLLLAGASWMAEYGNPDDPSDWAFIARYSPYHNLRRDTEYPPVLVTTSTRDDRVHPGHARKFVARLLEYGKDVTYYENTEGGHGGAADNPQRAKMEALVYAWLAERLRLAPR
jgi:prolyl oligopeptidase